MAMITVGVARRKGNGTNVVDEDDDDNDDNQPLLMSAFDGITTIGGDTNSSNNNNSGAAATTCWSWFSLLSSYRCRCNCRRLWIPSCFVFSAIVWMILYTPSSNNNNNNNNSNNSSSNSNTKENTRKKNNRGDNVVVFVDIFCYGDSLTYGMGSGHRGEVYPYANYLESALVSFNDSNNSTDDQTTTYQYKYNVGYDGYPGWKSDELFELICRGDKECSNHSVVSLHNNNDNNNDNNNNIQQQQHNNQLLSRRSFTNDTVRNTILSLGRSSSGSNGGGFLMDRHSDHNSVHKVGIFIYLAGTNDLIKRSIEDIYESIIAVHEWAVIANTNSNNDDGNTNTPPIITIAVGIPSSRFQEDARNPDIKSKVTSINKKLKEWAATAAPAAEILPTTKPIKHHYYVDFPFGYDINTDHDHLEQSLWSYDGLHMSKQGYQALGEYLAQIVQEISSSY